MDSIKNENLDRRVKYTKMVIKDSLLELLKQEPINKITVTQVCELADINRGTFYKYYLDTYDLLDQIESELFQELLLEIDQLKYTGIDDMEDFITRLFESIKKKQNICKIIFSGNGNKEIIQKLFYIVHDKVIEDWKNKNKMMDEKTLDYMFSFLANGSISVIQKWIETGCKEKPRELSKILNGLMLHGVKDIL
jgi:AcrR family transcriptional regulator